MYLVSTPVTSAVKVNFKKYLQVWEILGRNKYQVGEISQVPVYLVVTPVTSAMKVNFRNIYKFGKSHAEKSTSSGNFLSPGKKC